jgi:hypothetical protein
VNYFKYLNASQEFGLIRTAHGESITNLCLAFSHMLAFFPYLNTTRWTQSNSFHHYISTMTTRKSGSFFENSRDSTINGGNFLHSEDRTTQHRETVFHAPIYGYTHVAANDGPVIGYYNQVTIGESGHGRHDQPSPSPGNNSWLVICDKLALMPTSS